MGQSTISTHLAQLKQAGLVEDRRTGKNILYRLKRCSPAGASDGAAAGRRGRNARSRAGLRGAGAGRCASARTRCGAYFDELAGKFGRQYVPGRSLEGAGRDAADS